MSASSLLGLFATTTQSYDWKTIGDASHVASLFNVILFTAFVMRSIYGDDTMQGPIDPKWKQDGFCVANADLPFYTSHDLCLYADVTLAGVLGIAYYLLHKYPHMTNANTFVRSNILGVLAHGIGHASIAKAIRDGTASSSNETFNNTGWQTLREKGDWSEIIPQMIALAVFWIGLLRASMADAKPAMVGLVSLISYVLLLFVPNQLNFTFVQTILFLAFDLSELSKPSKDKGCFEYAMFPLMVGIPVSLVGWIESTQCSNFVLALGGHLIYDAFIPVSVLVFYLVCWFRKQHDGRKPNMDKTKEM